LQTSRASITTCWLFKAPDHNCSSEHGNLLRIDRFWVIDVHLVCRTVDYWVGFSERRSDLPAISTSFHLCHSYHAKLPSNSLLGTVWYPILEENNRIEAYYTYQIQLLWESPSMGITVSC